jgi:hypothetical protein
MPFGYVETKRLPLGLGDLYLNNTFVGQLKGNVNFHYKASYAYQRPGNMLADVKGERTMEEVTITAEVCELKLSQLRLALGINQAVTAATATTIKKRQQITLNSTTAVTVAQTILAGSLRVLKLDRSTTYVSGTDYTATATLITRKSGAITSGQNVLIEYNFSDSTAKSVQVGGELTAVNTFDLLFTHELSDGKTLQIELYKAMVNTDFQVAFHEKSSGSYTTYNVEFKALVDLTKLEGNQLFQITEQAAP